MLPQANVEIIPHQGVNYRAYLRRLHEALKPSTYLEIGTAQGSTLLLAQCASIAIDPSFSITLDIMGRKPFCHLFQMKSDDFFRDIDLKEFFPDGIDFAFLDGMHWFEYLLRDFINVERHCRSDSVVVLHDCLPLAVELTERSFDPSSRIIKACARWWTGDVWKILPTLKKLRPELRLTAVDCPPTGLVICTNLNPNSTVLSDAYSDTVAELFPLELADYGLSRLFEEANIQSSKVRIDISKFDMPGPD